MEHAFIMTQILHIILSENIIPRDLEALQEYCELFQQRAHQLYPPYFEKLNLHYLRHLPSQIKDWGPAWVFSMFHFEDGNAKIKKLVKGPTEPISSIAQLYNLTLARPRCSKYNSPLIELDGCRFRAPKDDQVLTHVRIGKSNIIATCYTRLEKRCNSLCSLDDGTVVNVERFYIDSGHVFAVCQLWTTSKDDDADDDDDDDDDSDILSMIPQIRTIHQPIKKQTVIRANKISNQLVKVEVGDTCYGINIPNRVEKDM